MKNRIIKVLSALVPKKSWRQYLQANFDFFDLDINKTQTKAYGKIYLPIYNRYAKINADEPEIYNADGTKVRTFFLRDKHFIFSNMQVSKHFMFDRYNFELPVHFYTHNAMRQTMGKPNKKYGLLMESKEIVPEDYLIFEHHPKLAAEFDSIFTFDEKILDKVKNAKEFCMCANINFFGASTCDIKNPDWCAQKTKNVSICSSNKLSCDLHKLRYDWACLFKNNPLVDTFGTFDGGAYVTALDYLKDYRYSIAVENDIRPYWFTEKILNCFATKTVPIYVGHEKMLERFNPDGIIFIKPEDYGKIEDIIKQCSAADYEARRAAIEDNFERVQKYINPFDRLWDMYLKKEL